MLRLQLHKPPLAVFGVQVECTPNKQRRRNRPEQQAEPRVDTGHIEHDDQHEQSQQSAREEKEVLAFQALELGTAADTFVDTVFRHSYKKKERRMVAATIRKMQAPNHEAAVFCVSGSPDVNFP